MGEVCNALHWTPDAFWRCTPHEFMALFEVQDE
jgi:hypothetical protein